MSTREGKCCLSQCSCRCFSEAGSTLQPMRMLAARSPIPPHSSLITMKQLPSTPCHNLTWLYLAQRFVRKPFPSFSGRGTPREIAHGSRVVLSGQSSFIADTIVGNVLGLGMSWVIRIILPSSCFSILGTLFWYCTTCIFSQGENMLLTQAFTLLLDCIHSSSGTIGVKWSSKKGLYFQIRSTSMAKDPTRSYPPNGKEYWRSWHRLSNPTSPPGALLVAMLE